jgi:hypothetical protein
LMDDELDIPPAPQLKSPELPKPVHRTP